MSTSKTIEARYAGCRFRSRLEARWAIFFDHLGIEWEHEPEGFETLAGPYLPDFRIDIPQTSYAGNHHQWFEVKPMGAPLDPRHEALARESHDPLIVARGMPRGYHDQMRASRHANQLDSPLMIYGVEPTAWPVAFCDSSTASWDRAFYCSLGQNRHWCQEHTHQSLAGYERCHLALYGLHLPSEGYGHDGFMTHPPLEGLDIDAAYEAARSERFGT